MASPFNWNSVSSISARRFTCWMCGAEVASKEGWFAGTVLNPIVAHVYVCPLCASPNYFDAYKVQHPGVAFGEPVADIDDEGVKALYEEARKATAASCFTAAVMCCRVILMHVAVLKGAEEGKPFAHYVDFLDGKGYVPPDGKAWVDYIRKKGNNANHRIEVMTQEDAKYVLTFTGMLLKFIFEMSAAAKRLPAPPKT